LPKEELFLESRMCFVPSFAPQFKIYKTARFRLSELCAGFQTIAASGISSLEDLRQLNRLGCRGAVVGRALYEGGIKLPVAKQAVAYKNTLAKRIIACFDIKSGRVVKGVHFR
jgi:phosphoribosylformimino-5-aminoimidazole carboxamide ribonucleotide (ProFAR) isomerase